MSSFSAAPVAQSFAKPARSSTAAQSLPTTPVVRALLGSAIFICRDLDSKNSAAAAARIKALGGAAVEYDGPADQVVDEVLNALNPYGLHLAFLDPFNLGQLPFSIIEKMLGFKRMDLIIHVSLQDLQRNLDEYSSVGDKTLDNFAPGWRNEVDTSSGDRATSRGSGRLLAQAHSCAR